MKQNKTGKRTEDIGTENCTNGMCGVANGTFEEISKHWQNALLCLKS